jgi:N12 class adenine-specific DNA methylase/adenine-specific DNA methylase
MPSDDLVTSQFNLDLFGNTTLTPADLAPVGLIRIPMKEAPAAETDAGAGDTDSNAPPTNPIGSGFRLDGNRGLAQGWKNRALDNIAAIRLAAEIEGQGRAATAEEQAQLIKFCAFSSTDLAQSVFRRAGAFREGWEDIGASLEGLVSRAELAGLARATQYAHFTPEFLVRALWSAVTGFGFAGGWVLDPGCGTGLFIALEPEAVAGACNFTGIEADPVTARIARLLYPDSAIRTEDFTKAKLTPGFDLVIGNPPFSDRTVRLPEANGKLSLSLHDAFIGRSLAHLRPGGLAAFVVSRWTMDKGDRTARAFFRDQADLIAAIRLPAGAMRADAGTDVVVDLLFFQAREPGRASAGADFVDTAEVLAATEDGEAALSINRYFLDHPSMVLGRHNRTSSPYGVIYTCAGTTGAALQDALNARIADLPKQIHIPTYPPDSHPAASEIAARVGTVAEGAALREGSYLVLSNRLHQIVSGVPEEVAIRRGKREGIPRQHDQVIDSLIPVRDAVRDILRAQEADQPYRDAQIRLRRAYASFVRSFGPINRTQSVTITDEDTGEVREIVRRPNLAIFADDPDVWLVSSIEEYDPETGKASHGPIFDKRIILPPAQPIIVDAADALTVSLHEVGRVDIDFVAEQLGCTPAEAEAELGNLVFLGPETKRFETADAYLSGKVREKLAAADSAAAADSRFLRNVEALRGAQPVDLKPSEITARPGAPWLPTDVVAAFAKEVIGVGTPVYHVAAVAHWSIDISAFSGHADCRTTWGTGRRHAGELLDDALNAHIPQVWDVWYEDGHERRELNAGETEAAKDKLAAIKLAFENWVWIDPARADQLAKIYNERFNDLFARHFDGSHLQLPGASAVISFYRHQKRAIWRVISAGSTYIAHAVGAGKTFSMAAAVTEQKRLGLITKAMMVVPGHCLAQANREFLQLYPTARILVADETNFAKAERQRFLARAATGEWDCIIITHAAFKFIPVSASFEQDMIQTEIVALEDILETVDDADRISKKRIERIKEEFEDKLKGLKNKKDDLLTIGAIGVDQIIVDEAQEFRKLTFPTNMGTLKGVDPDGSQRAWDLFVKSRFIETINPGRALIMASGTPITNTMGELFTLQRYFAEDLLRARDIHSFDAWAANFGEAKTELELQPSGLYKPATRFSEFVNVPELIDIFRHFADVVQKCELRQHLKLPRIAGGKRQLVTAEATPMFRAYQQVLDQRIKAIEARKGRPEKGDDILLSVIGDGRHAAIDLRLVVPTLPNDPLSKLNMMIGRVVEIYHRTADNIYYAQGGVPYAIRGAAQFIFSDLGTVNAEAVRGFSVYRWIKQELTRRGIPVAEIAFIHDYKKASQKQALFADINAGRIKILIGSTQKMGTGVNAQRRLKALHHLDVPWLPSDIEQREGRIERQGNQNDEIEIYAYATLTSMDATMWQANERKQRFIEAALSGDRSIRRLEDASSQSNQFAMAKALASGDQRLIQKAGLDAEIARLERLRAAHLDNQLSIRHTVQGARNTIADAGRKLDGIRRDIARRAPTRGDQFAMTVQDRRHTERKAAGGALLRLIAEAGWGNKTNMTIGTIGGFDLSIGLSRDLRMRVTEVALILQCDNRQRIELPDEPTPLGVIARLEGALDRFETDHREQEERLAAARNRLADYEPRIGEAFEFEAELLAKRAEYDRLDADLAAQSNREATKAEQDAASAFEKMFGVVIQFPGRGRAAEAEAAEEPEDADAEAG